MPSRRRVLAVPVLSQLVPLGRVHRGDQLEGIKRLAPGVHLLEDDTHGLFRGRLVESNDRHMVHLEIVQNLLLERAEFVANTLVLVAGPMLVEAVLPFVPVKDLRNGIH